MAVDPSVIAGTATPSVAADPGFPTSAPSSSTVGPREAADARRQAGFQMAADEPEDINVNAVISRSQVETFDVIGKAFASNEDARQKMTDAATERRAMMQEQFFARQGLK